MVPKNQWVELTLEWDTSRRTCQVWLDGKFVTTLPLRRDVPFGPSYLRVADASPDANETGWLVDFVSARSMQEDNDVKVAHQNRH